MVKVKKLPSGNWNAVVYMGTIDGKRQFKSITRPTKAECEFAVAQFRKEKKHIDRRLTVRQAVDKYISTYSPLLSPVTADTYARRMKFAFSSIMDMPCEELTDEILQKAINTEAERKNAQTGKQIAPKTVREEFSIISAALKKEGYSFDVKLPKIHRKPKLLPEPEEVIAAIKGTNIELPCLLAMWMSLRMEEITALTVDSVQNDMLKITRTRSTIAGEEIIKEYAKTEESLKIAKIPKYILELIHNTETYKNNVKSNKTALLFPYTGNALHHRFRRQMGKAGIDITFHDLRHIFASVSLNKLNIASKQVQLEGGWKSDKILNRVYSQTFNSVQEQAFSLRNDYYESLLK